MPHDFKLWPELTNSQLERYYFQSPHKQITEDFDAKVVRVIDGDTVDLRWRERNFDFPVRLSWIAAPEMDEEGGAESKSWLERQILGKHVDIRINPKMRVGKWGRILGEIISMGMNINEESLRMGMSVPFKKKEQSFWQELEWH